MTAKPFTLVSVGGGLGSFTLIDTLRIAGVPASEICAIGPHRSPIEQYETSLDNSGIGLDDRLRSESCSTLDNPWGFPGYAPREAVRTRRFGPILRVLGEATFVEYYTPRRADVVQSVTREAERISWRDIHRTGFVERLRRTEGHYEVTYSDGVRSHTVRALNLHIALGPGPMRSPKDSEHITRSQGAARTVFHVYEPHDVIRREARARPITVAVRGGGIAASHAVDELLQLRRRCAPDLRVVHIVRDAYDGRRQAFNVPKAAWGGQYLDRLTKADEHEADQLLGELARTTIPARGAVAKRRKQAIGAGYLVELAHPDPTLTRAGHLLAIDVGDLAPPRLADYAIDATGFHSGVSAMPVVDSFLASCGVTENHLGRIDVDESFAAAGLDNAVGRTYVSGALAFGRRYGAPDTFLGLHFASHHIAKDLAGRHIGRRYRADRSFRWWTRWLIGRRPIDHPVPSATPAMIRRDQPLTYRADQLAELALTAVRQGTPPDQMRSEFEIGEHQREDWERLVSRLSRTVDL